MSLHMPSNDAKRCDRRRSITNAQRRALRAWFFNDSFSSMDRKAQSDASLWWKETYGYHLNSSTVSEILSYKYAYLDEEDLQLTGAARSDRKRDRSAKWPELEEDLSSWVYHYQAAGGQVSGPMLRQKATELWYQLPCYRDQLCPKWSDGWRARFLARQCIQGSRQSAHELSSNVPLDGR